MVVGWWLVVRKKKEKKGEGEGGKRGGKREAKGGKKAGVILPCRNGYYDNNIKVLLIVVEEVEKNKVSFIGNIISSSK